MSPPVAPTTPQVGEQVLSDGEMHEIKEIATRYASDTGEKITALMYESERRKLYGLMRDLIFSPELGCWYRWGCCLNAEQYAVVIELRDRGILKARATRTPGNAPAAGEQHNLYLALFHNADHELWPAAMSSIRSGQGIPAEAATRIADLAERFKTKLEYGYADRDADDSWDEEEGK